MLTTTTTTTVVYYLLVGGRLLPEGGRVGHERLDLHLRRLQLLDQEVAHRLRVLHTGKAQQSKPQNRVSVVECN